MATKQYQVCARCILNLRGINEEISIGGISSSFNSSSNQLTGKNPAVVTPVPVVPTRPEKQETKNGRPATDDDDLEDDAEAFDDDYFEDTVDETSSTADGDDNFE
jgi:hypothetical protein